MIMDSSSAYSRVFLCLFGIKNISFIFADADWASEDIIIGFFILKHSGIESRRLINRNISLLNETKYTSVDKSCTALSCEYLGRQIIAHMQ